MLADDFVRFEKAIRGLEFTYGKKVSEEAMQQYWRALKDLPFEQVNERIQSHARYSKFFPKPVELRPKEQKPQDKDPAYEALKAKYERDEFERLERLRMEHPQEWLRILRPKCHAMGRERGMTYEQVEAKLQTALECVGPRSN